MQFVTFGKFDKTCWPTLQNFLTIAWSTWSTNRIKKVCFVTSNLWHALKISKYFVLFSCIFNLLERNQFLKNVWLIEVNCREACSQIHKLENLVEISTHLALHALLALNTVPIKVIKPLFEQHPNLILPMKSLLSSIASFIPL